MSLLWFFNYFIISLIILIISLVNISFLTLWERKLLAGIQRRQGPVFVGVFGLLQPFADGLKLAIKAVNVPQGAYYYVFFISAIASLILSLLSWTIIPFNSSFVFADNSLSLLLVLAISSLNVYSILFSGWASNSKYGLLGSIRAGAQMISYEIPISLSLFPLILIESSFNLQNLVLYQLEKNLWNCYLLPSIFIFFVASLAETNRAPFDLPEAESELVAGYNMEYSALLFAVFFLAEYNHIILMSAIIVSIYFGGWSIPAVILENPVYSIFPWIWMLETFIFIVKLMFITSLFIVIRACVPRYKYTDLIIICWESFIPVLTCFLIVLFIINPNACACENLSTFGVFPGIYLYSYSSKCVAMLALRLWLASILNFIWYKKFYTFSFLKCIKIFCLVLTVCIMAPDIVQATIYYPLSLITKFFVYYCNNYIEGNLNQYIFAHDYNEFWGQVSIFLWHYKDYLEFLGNHTIYVLDHLSVPCEMVKQFANILCDDVTALAGFILYDVCYSVLDNVLVTVKFFLRLPLVISISFFMVKCPAWITKPFQ